MKAVIGRGRRGHPPAPVDVTLCKPMLPVANRPMQHVIYLLRRHGFNEFSWSPWL